MSAKRTIFNQRRGKQCGAVLMVMLVIMIIGAVTIFVMSLNSSALQIERDKITADALAKAKDALIGRAVADGTSPGSLPCPDTNNDGSAESTVTPTPGNCPSYIGRLPWKTLGLSDDLRDGYGERLWYALSPNFRDYVTSNPINSNSQGNLTVSGATTASNVIAIVFAPGAVVSGQSRSPTNMISCTTSGTSVTENLCATNYLEGSNANLNTATSPNLSYQTAAASSTFNDRLLPIMASDLIPVVEARVAKELSNAFASYLLANGNKYPYPVNFPNDMTTPVCIGKIPTASLTTLPAWFAQNNWDNVIYYSAGTNVLPGGVGGAGNKGKGKGGKGSGGLNNGGGGGAISSGTGCYATTLTVSGTSVNVLFIMPGTPLGTQSRTGVNASLSSSNLSQYFEDPENANLDNVYVIPGSSSNDSLDALP